MIARRKVPLTTATGEMLRFSEASLTQDLMHDVTVDVGQAEITAAEAECQLFVVEAQQVQHRCVQVVDRADVFDGIHSKIVGGSVNRASFNASTG